MLPVRGILERPVAQHCEPEGALAARRPCPHLVLRAPRLLRLLGGGQDRCIREAPHLIWSGVKFILLSGFGGPWLLRVGALGSLFGGGGALRGSRSAAARRRVPGPAIVMARPGTLPGSPGAAHPLRVKTFGAGRRLRVAPCRRFVGLGPAAPARPAGGSQVRTLVVPTRGSPRTDRACHVPNRFLDLSLLMGPRCRGSLRAVPGDPDRMHTGVTCITHP